MPAGDEQREEVGGPGGDRYERRSREAEGASVYKRVLEVLVTSTVIAMVIAVWNLTQTATLLQASQDAQRRDIDRIEKRQDMLEGKLTRGGPDAALADK